MTILSLKSYQQAALDALARFARSAQMHGAAQEWCATRWRTTTRSKSFVAFYPLERAAMLETVGLDLLTPELDALLAA